jgi:MYXO-CTERM domain-containing protein
VTETDIGVQDRVNRVQGLGHSGGGIFDFEVSGLTPGGSTKVVLPQAAPLPAVSIYRKYTVAKGWFDFTATGGNQLASALSVGGVCPGPTDNVAYDDALGLVGGHDCVRLTIVDGSTMDADAIANGKVSDPGTVSNNGPATQGSGVSSFAGCSMNTSATATDPGKHAEWWLLAGLLSFLGWRRKQRS